MEWLTEWAFCYIALYGTGFVAAGGRVAKLLGESGLGAVAQTSLVSPLLYLGGLVGLAVGVGASLLTMRGVDGGTLEAAAQLEEAYRWLQPLVGGLVGFTTASVGLSCVDAANKTIFVCYVDCPEQLGARCPEAKAAIDSSPHCRMGGGVGGQGARATASAPQP